MSHVGRRSLRTKLVRTVTVVLLAVGVCVIAAVGTLQVREAEGALKALESQIQAELLTKGEALTTNQALALRAFAVDNAFTDVATLVSRAVERDNDLVYGTYIDAQGKVWAYASPVSKGREAADESHGELGLSDEQLKASSAGHRRRELFGRQVIEFTAPVVYESERLGTLVYGVSTQRVSQALATARSSAAHRLRMALGLLTALVGALAAAGAMLTIRQSRRITEPMEELTRAVGAIKQGQLGTSVSIHSGDELEELGSAFNQMACDLSASYAKLKDLNDALEQRVIERTAALSRRNQEMRLVFDNVVQGLFTVGPDGRLSQERSATIDVWFPHYAHGLQARELFAVADRAFADMFELNWEMLQEDSLPRDVCIAQLPRRLLSAGRQLELAYVELPDVEGVFGGVLVTALDVTDSEAHEREEARQREQMAACQYILSDRPYFMAFHQDVSEVLEHARTRRLTDVDPEFARELHTLKGNSSVLGLETLASRVHELEDRIADGDASAAAEARDQLCEHWSALNDGLAPFLRDEFAASELRVPISDYDQLMSKVASGVELDALAPWLATWRLRPVRADLLHLADHAQQLAERLGRGEIEIAVHDNGVRVDPSWSELWRDLVHVVRNAVDHGIAPAAERQRQAAHEKPRITLSAEEYNEKVIIKISDNGRGIDWDNLRRRADSQGLICRTHEELLQFMLRSGLSSREAVTQTSGRGVGLATAAHRVEAMGGTTSVISELGRGTQFSFELCKTWAANGHRASRPASLVPNGLDGSLRSLRAMS
jgi:signal transduction histidine kinase/HAMP domain-containing protein